VNSAITYHEKVIHLFKQVYSRLAPREYTNVK